MIQFDRRLRGFSEEMELLCTIPREEHAATLTTLTKDFGYATQDGVRRLIRGLVKRGITVKVWQGEPGYRVGIPSVYWKAAQKAANEYWTRVYG